MARSRIDGKKLQLALAILNAGNAAPDTTSGPLESAAALERASARIKPPKKGGGFDWKNALGEALNVVSAPLHAVTATTVTGGRAVGEALGREYGTHDYLYVDTPNGRQSVDAQGRPITEKQQHADDVNPSLGQWWKGVVNPKHEVNFGDVVGGAPEKGFSTSLVPSPNADKSLLPHVDSPIAKYNAAGRMVLGLTGDVALDPLTYLTGGAAHLGSEAVAREVAQSTARQALAKAAEEGGMQIDRAAITHALEHGGDIAEQLGKVREAAADSPAVREILDRGMSASAKARRLGVSGLDDADIAAFLTREGTHEPIATRGLRFGAGEHTVPIPLTDSAAGRSLGEAVAGLKAKLGDTFEASRLNDVFTEQTKRELTETARSGSPKDAFEAILTKAARDTAKPAAHALESAWAGKFTAMVRKFSPEEMELLPRALEGDAHAVAALDGAHEGVRDLLDTIHTRAREAGLNVRNVADYSPRELTPEGRQLLEQLGVAKKGGGFSPLGTFEKARSLTPDEDGLHHFAGETFRATTNADVTAKVNEIARRRLAEIDPKAAESMAGFFNPDIESAMQHYFGRVANRVSQADAASRLYAAGIGNASRESVPDAAAAQAADVLAEHGGRAGRLADALEPESVISPQTAPEGPVGPEGALNGLGEPGEASNAAEGHVAPLTDNLGQAAQSVEPSPGLAGSSPTIHAERVHLAADVHAFLTVHDAIGTARSEAEKADLFGQLMSELQIRPPGAAPDYTLGDVTGVRAAQARYAESLMHDPPAMDRALRNIEQALKGRAAESDAQLARYTDALPSTSPQVGASKSVRVERSEQSALSAIGQGPTVEHYETMGAEQAAQRRTLLGQEIERVDVSLADDALSPAARDALQSYADDLRTSAQWADVQHGPIAEGRPDLQRVAAMEQAGAEASAQLADLHSHALGLKTLSDSLSDAQVEQLTAAFRDGMQTELRRGIGTPQQTADWLFGAQPLATPEGMRDALRRWDKVVGWLKDFQIATPGFHVRNWLSIEFNNAMAGVDASSKYEFIKTWSRVMRGKEDTLAPEALERFRDIERAVGTGQVGSESSMGTTIAQKLGETSVNPLSRRGFVVRTSQAAGHEVEFYGRGALAWDVLRKGGTVDDAVAAVNRFHFDYSDLSRFEQGLKHVMPFYTWTRKNLPLQVEMILTNPKMYSRLASAKYEIERESTPDEVVPSYFGDLMGIRLPFTSNGGHVYSTADLPPSDLVKWSGSPREDVEQALSMLTPVVKLPIEMKFNQQFFKDIPLSDSKPVPVPLPALLVRGLAPVLETAGVAKNVDGNLYMSEKDAYTLEQAMPVIARYRRLAPKEDKYQSRRLTSILSFFGIGTQTNSKQLQDAYTKGVEFERRDKASGEKRFVDRGEEAGQRDIGSWE